MAFLAIFRYITAGLTYLGGACGGFPFGLSLFDAFFSLSFLIFTPHFPKFHKNHSIYFFFRFSLYYFIWYFLFNLFYFIELKFIFNLIPIQLFNMIYLIHILLITIYFFRSFLNIFFSRFHSSSFISIFFFDKVFELILFLWFHHLAFNWVLFYLAHV